MDPTRSFTLDLVTIMVCTARIAERVKIATTSLLWFTLLAREASRRIKVEIYNSQLQSFNI